MPTQMKAPTHLKAATRAWFVSVLDTYELQPHHIRLLQLAAEAWDRTQQARALIAHDGLVMMSRQGVKPHPAVAIERDSRLAFARLLRELDLDIEPPATERYAPPPLRSNRR